jgi:hypothetical protein
MEHRRAPEEQRTEAHETEQAGDKRIPHLEQRGVAMQRQRAKEAEGDPHASATGVRSAHEADRGSSVTNLPGRASSSRG